MDSPNPVDSFLSGITFIETFEYLLFVKCLVSIVDDFDSGQNG